MFDFNERGYPDTIDGKRVIVVEHNADLAPDLIAALQRRADEYVRSNPSERYTRAVLRPRSQG
jgi:hypothetical protein